MLWNDLNIRSIPSLPPAVSGPSTSICNSAQKHAHENRLADVPSTRYSLQPTSQHFFTLWISQPRQSVL